MSLGKWSKKELPIPGFKKPKRMLYSAASLASVESLSLPLVQEIVVSADMSCADCQKRVADMMSRMNGSGTESVLVDVLGKKVTLTCSYPAVKVTILRESCWCVQTQNCHDQADFPCFLQ